MKIFIGSDHGGFELKEFLKDYLVSKGHEIVDEGCYSKDSVDYPLYGFKVAKNAVQENTFGIAICTSGVGISMAANKIKGARAVNVLNEDMAMLSRMHNNANILCFGAKYVTKDLAIKCLEIFLETTFEGGRHERRVNLLNEGEDYER